MGKQSYVIVRNLRPARSVFGGHQANYINLQPFGDAKGEDSIKILLDEKNLQGAVAHYATLRKGGEYQVSFSEGVDDSHVSDSMSKMTVISTADVDQKQADRVAFLRTQAKIKADSDKLAGARQTRARAEATVAANKGNNMPPARSDAPVSEEEKEAVKADRQPIALEVKEGELEDAGVELTAETLGAMGRAQVIEIATKMGVQIRQGVSKGGLIKAILLKVGI